MKKVWVLVVAVIVAATASPVRADYHDEAEAKAVEWDQRPGAENIIAPAVFEKSPTGEKDRIVVDTDDVKFEVEYVDAGEDCPYVGTHLFTPYISISDTMGGLKVTVDVEGRKGIGAVYWVRVRPIGAGTGNGGPSDPYYLWADVLDEQTPKSQTLVLEDKIADPHHRSVVFDAGAGASGILYCMPDPDANNEGKVKFKLHDVEAGTSYNWEVPGVQNGNGTLTDQNNYQVLLSGIDLGSYTLTVTDDNSFERKINFVVVGIQYKRIGVDEDWVSGVDADIVFKLIGHEDRSGGTVVAVRHTVTGLDESEYPPLNLGWNINEGVDYRLISNAPGEPPWQGPEGVARFMAIRYNSDLRVRWCHGHGDWCILSDCDGPLCFTSDNFRSEKLIIRSYAVKPEEVQWSHFGGTGIASTFNYFLDPGPYRTTAMLRSPYVNQNNEFVPVLFDVEPYYGISPIDDENEVDWSIETNPGGNAAFVDNSGAKRDVIVDTASNGGVGKYQFKVDYLGGWKIIDAYVALAKFEDSIGSDEPPYPEYILSGQRFSYPFIVGFEGPEGVTYDVKRASVRFRSDPELEIEGKYFDKISSSSQTYTMGTSFENPNISSGEDGYLYTVNNEFFRIRDQLPAWQNEARLYPWIVVRGMELTDGYYTTEDRLSNKPVSIKWTHPDLQVLEIGETPVHQMKLTKASGYFMRPGEFDPDENPDKIETCKSAVLGFSHFYDVTKAWAYFDDQDNSLLIWSALHSQDSSFSGEEWTATKSVSYEIVTAFSYPERKNVDSIWGENGVCDLRITSRRLYPVIAPDYDWLAVWQDIADSEASMSAIWLDATGKRLSITGLGLGAVALLTPPGWIGLGGTAIIGGASLVTGGLSFGIQDFIARQSSLDLTKGHSGGGFELLQHAYFIDWGEEDYTAHDHFASEVNRGNITIGSGSVSLLSDQFGNGLMGALQGHLYVVKVGQGMVGGWQGTTSVRNVSLGGTLTNKSEVKLIGESLQPEVHYEWEEDD